MNTQDDPDPDPDPNECEQLAQSIAISPSLLLADRDRAIEILQWAAGEQLPRNQGRAHRAPSDPSCVYAVGGRRAAEKVIRACTQP